MTEEGGGYYIFWAIGILLLLGGLIFSVIRYRQSRAGRAQSEIERRSVRWNPKD